MKVAVVGATGLVGTRMLEVLEERNFPVSKLLAVASEKSLDKKVKFAGKEYSIISAQQALEERPDIAIFSAGSEISKTLAPQFAELGTKVIDNSSCWRMDPSKKLIIPEINGDIITKDDFIIANPNCSTIQMLMALAPLHKAFKIKRIVVSTYQSVTGSGNKAVSQMECERKGQKWGEYKAFYPYPIDKNILPHIDTFLENGYSKEEMKMVNETHKILGDESIEVSPTTVRVPVQGGHSESINVEFHQDCEVEEIRELWRNMPGVIVQDDPQNNIYPMPLYAYGKDEVFLGRLRKDPFQARTFNFWCVADNIRKGAATNAVQIAEKLLELGLVKE